MARSAEEIREANLRSRARWGARQRGEDVPLMRMGRPSRPLKERFDELVEPQVGADACWIWKGRLGEDGYGIIKACGRMMRAHRVAWELANGQVPSELWVLHRCDVRDCVRAEHLFLGTHDDNMADMRAKGRQASGDRHGTHVHADSVRRGESHGAAKLTREQVMLIRANYALGATTQQKLGECFGVSRGAINHILRHESWKGPLCPA